jgi:uncharacterized protein YdaU (DUF1376 family)
LCRAVKGLPVNYYQFHIGDYRRDTAHLSLLEHGIYRQMLDLYYLSESPLPSDEEKLMRMLCVRIADEVRAFKNVLADFFVLTEKGYEQSRCLKAISEYRAKSGKASDSANARWRREKENKDANAMRTHSEGNANHKPLTNKPLTNTPLPPKGDEDFVSFWKAYPKKDGKGYALKAWLKAKKSKILPPVNIILEAISTEKQSKKWTKDNGQFIPNPATWINGQGWENSAGKGEKEDDERLKRFIEKNQPGGIRAADQPVGTGIPGQAARGDT